MKKGHYEIIIRHRFFLGHGEERIDLSEVARSTGLHPDVVRRFLTLGLIEPATEEPEPLFTQEAILRIKRINRLRQDMGVNLASAGIILDLLDQIEKLREQLRKL